MNRYKLSKVGINANEGISRFGGNGEIYEKFLNKFPEDENFANMCKAIESMNVTEAFSYAHALKGVVGNLSMTRMYDHLCLLVEELRKGSLVQADLLLKPVIEDYTDIIQVLVPSDDTK